MEKNMKIYWNVLKAINGMIPYEECHYRNMVVATAFSKGKQDRLTENWVKNALLQDYEDDFITYEQAVALNPIYIAAIESLKLSF